MKQNSTVQKASEQTQEQQARSVPVKTGKGIESKFKRDFKYGQIIAWAIPASIGGLVIYLNYNVFHGQSLPMNFLTGAAIVASSVYLYYSSSGKPSVARYCLILECLVALAFMGNIVLHVMLHSELTVLDGDKMEREIETKKTLQVESERTQNSVAQLQAASDYVAKQASLVARLPRSERKANMITMPNVEQHPLGLASNPVPAQSANDASNLVTVADFVKAKEKKEEDENTPKTEAGWKRLFLPRLWISTFIDAGLAILGLLGLSIVHKWKQEGEPGK